MFATEAEEEAAANISASQEKIAVFVDVEEDLN